MNSLYHTKIVTFWNDGTFTRTSSLQGLPVILKWHNVQSLDKALDLFIKFKFCESEFYFLNGSKNCMVATYNFGSVYTPKEGGRGTSPSKNGKFIISKLKSSRLS